MLPQDTSELRNRSGFVTAGHKCDLCRQPLLTRDFYLFPCTHVFHVDCITAEVQKCFLRNPAVCSAFCASVCCAYVHLFVIMHHAPKLKAEKMKAVQDFGDEKHRGTAVAITSGQQEGKAAVVCSSFANLRKSLWIGCVLFFLLLFVDSREERRD